MIFTPEQQQFLLHLARSSIENVVARKPFETGEVPDRLKEPGACFVTLTKNGQLRGCIGSLVARQLLYKDVLENAKHAALDDPRFPQVREEELSAIRIEVSVLSAPVERNFKDDKELIAIMTKERPGLVIHAGFYSATFLPQVWEQVPRPDEFVSHLCRKAGLPPHAWKDKTFFKKMKFETYTVEKIEK